MKRALDASDKASFAAWLDALCTAITGAHDAGIEAVRSRRERTLSRAELRRRMNGAYRRMADLVDAARRGIGPTLQAPVSEPPADPEPAEPPAP